MSDSTWGPEEDIETRCKGEILRRLKERRDLYVAHCENGRKDHKNNIYFHTPFLSPVELYAHIRIDQPNLSPYKFGLAMRHLIDEKSVAVVAAETYAVENDPNDFRNAHLGDLFLNYPQLVTAYERSVANHKLHDNADVLLYDEVK